MRKMTTLMMLFSLQVFAESVEKDLSLMSKEDARAYEMDTLKRVADLALLPPELNTSPLPEYDYYNLDYGMTIGIERTPGGRLWACWVGGEDGPKAFFVLNRSDDNGESWSRPCLVIDTHASDRLPMRRSTLVGNLWTDPSGKLHLFFNQSMEAYDGRAGTWETVCENPDAEEPVWSKPRRIWHGFVLNKPTVLSTGEWLLPLEFPNWNGLGMFGLMNIFEDLAPLRGANMFVSNDQGETWTRRSAVKFPNPSWPEHMFVELNDGRLWMLARTGKGIMQCFSSDGGHTWTEPSFPTFSHPASRFFVRRLASGRILLIKHGEAIDSNPGRAQLTAWLSEDEGQTWTGGLVLDERTGVTYPDGFQAPDGTIYISYDRNRSTDGEILMARFTEADILAKQLVSSGSKLKILISRPLKNDPVLSEDFTNPTSTDFALTTVNWHVYMGSGATAADETNINWAAGPVISAPDYLFYLLSSDYAGQPVLTWTDLNMTGSILYMKATLRSNNTSEDLKFALKVNGAWYVSQKVFNNTVLGADTEVGLDVASASWNRLTVIPGSAMAEGGAATLPVSGNIEAVGMFDTSDSSERVRINQFTVYGKGQE